MRTSLSLSHHQDGMAEETRGKTCASILTLPIWSFLPFSRLPRLDFRIVCILPSGVLSSYGRSVSIFGTLSKCLGPSPAKSKPPPSLLPTYALSRCYFHLRSMWLASFVRLKSAHVCCVQKLAGTRFSGTSTIPWVTGAHVPLALTRLQTHTVEVRLKRWTKLPIQLEE